MDSTLFSARQVALMLGTSIPRVKRAISQAIVKPVEGTGGRVGLTPDQLETLREHLGKTPPIPGLTRSEALVSAALARAPFGLSSARAAAERAGISPTAAGNAIESLREKNLITVGQRTIAAGRAQNMELIRANYSSPRWQRLAAALARVEPRARHREMSTKRVPPRLGHLFWNTAPSQLDTVRAGGYIARRLLSTSDPEGLAWGAANLSAEDWRHAARTRGISPPRRALALNIAADRERIGSPH
jgi:hypothetical protein